MFKILALVVTIALVPKPAKHVTLKMASGHNHYLITNPFLKPVQAVLDCGDDYERITVEVPARTTQEIFLDTGANGELAICQLVS